MITKLKFVDDHLCFTKGQEFEFKPITLLVGDQGCGKSTMLGIIKNGNAPVSVARTGPSQDKVLALDMEKDNPRTSPADVNNAASYKMSLVSHFQSHGEVLLPIIKFIDDAKNAYITLDEPETALSLRSQFLLVDLLKSALTRGNQIFVATHNLVLMEAFPDSILSLEHERYVTPEEFVELQKQPSDFKDVRDDKRIKKEKCLRGIQCECAAETGFYKIGCEHYIARGRRS